MLISTHLLGKNSRGMTSGMTSWRERGTACSTGIDGELEETGLQNTTISSFREVLETGRVKPSSLGKTQAYLGACER